MLSPMRPRPKTSSAALSALLTLPLSLSLLAASPAVAKKAAKPAASAAIVAGAAAATPTSPRPALQFTRIGKGPAVVLVHGLGGDRAVWADEMLRLSQRYTVVALDLPGHGVTAPPTQVSLQTAAQQIAKLIRDEKLAPATLIGHSLGGTLAAWTAVVDPGAVRGVLIVDSQVAPWPMPEADRARLRADLLRDPTTTLRRFYGPMTSSLRQLDKIVASAVRVPPATMAGYIDQSTSHDLDERVKDIRVPVHLIASSLTISNQDPSAARLAIQTAGYSTIPRFSYEVFPQSKHWLLWDEPEKFRTAVDHFLETVNRPNVSTAPAPGKRG